MRDRERVGEAVRVQDPAAAAAALLEKELAPACHRLAVAGAVRRRVHRPGCVDLVAIPKLDPATGDNLLWDLVDFFIADGRYLQRGELVRSFVCPARYQLGEIPVNVYLATAEAWGLRLLHRTGPDAFWFWVLKNLHTEGYTSQEGQIVRVADQAVMPIPEERDLFQLAGILPREGWQRERASADRRTW